VSTSSLNLPQQGAVILWEWEWIDDSETHVSETALSSDSEEILNPHDDGSVDSDSTHCSEQVEHTVTFKCIGSVHDANAQDTLRGVSQLLAKGDVVPVNIFCELDNPFDSRAVAFKCWYQDKWCGIGYVVKEALDAVHDALRHSEITDVCFKWAKYLVIWSKSGPDTLLV